MVLQQSQEWFANNFAELAQNTGSFAKSAAMLGNAEEHTALSRALSQLAEVEEKIDQLHMDQADNDFFVFSELIKDYIALIGAVKVSTRTAVVCPFLGMVEIMRYAENLFFAALVAGGVRAKSESIQNVERNGAKPDEEARTKSQIRTAAKDGQDSWCLC